MRGSNCLGFTWPHCLCAGRGTEDGRNHASLAADSTTRPTLLDKEYRELGSVPSVVTGCSWSACPTWSSTTRCGRGCVSSSTMSAYRCVVAVLQEHPQLDHQAQVHCLDMSARSYFSNVSPEGKDENHRAVSAGYEGKVKMLLSDKEDVEDAIKTWLHSASMRAAIIDSAMYAFGVGMFNGKWALLLGAELEIQQKPETELESDLLTAFNSQRSADGLPPFRTVPSLQKAAVGHSTDMNDKGFMAYEHPEARGVLGWIKEVGYRGRTFPAVTKGPTNADAVLKIFLGSAGHKQQLLNGELRDLGIGIKNGHWTVIPAAPQVEANGSVRDEFLGHLNSQRAASNAPKAEVCCCSTPWRSTLSRTW